MIHWSCKVVTNCTAFTPVSTGDSVYRSFVGSDIGVFGLGVMVVAMGRRSREMLRDAVGRVWGLCMRQVLRSTGLDDRGSMAPQMVFTNVGAL